MVYGHGEGRYRYGESSLDTQRARESKVIMVTTNSKKGRYSVEQKYIFAIANMVFQLRYANGDA